MIRILATLCLGACIGFGVAVAHHDAKEHDSKERVKPLSSREIKEKVDGKEASVTVVEVNIEPGNAGSPHRHPGPVFGYVLEGEYELGLDDQPSKVLKQGETFYEPTGCLHRVSKNPAAKGKTRVLAVVVHPRDAKEVAIPDKPKD